MFAAAALLFQACGSSDNDQMTEEQGGEKVKSCFYTFNPENTTVGWTAFKYTEKTAVKGVFDKFELKSSKSGDDLEKLCAALSLSIPVESVNSANEERDGKLRAQFFGNMNGDMIDARVTKFDKNGNGEIELTMNGVTRTEKAEMKLEDNATFTIHATFDMMDYKLDESYKALSEICHDLHIGKDGKAKLWTEMEIDFTTSFLSDCE